MPGIAQFTFKDSGVVVGVRKVSPLLAMELRKVMPPPKPPMQTVTVGDKVELVPNDSHPDYLKAVEDYNTEMELKMRRLIIKRGVVFELTPEQVAEVEDLKAFWLENYPDSPLQGTDKELFISYIAIGTDEDLTDLIDAILKRSQPTEAEVKEAVNSFPNQVQGS